MRKLMVGVFCAGAVIVGSGGIVRADQPTVPSCVGESVSDNAQTRHPYGAFIREVTPRNDFGSLGDAVHALQAGQVPDDLYANTCN